MDAVAAQYLFDMQIDSARHPRIASLVRDLKNNSGNDVNAFKDALLGLEGAHATVEDGVLLLTHQLIGQSNPGAVRISDELANLNAAIAYAKADGRNFSMSQGYSLHPDGTLTEHTIENTRAYTEIGGLDDGRPMFAIVSLTASSNSQPRDACTTASERICTDTRCSTLTAPCHVRCLHCLETVSAATPSTTSTIRRCRRSST